jgi:hypothetical protein
VGRTDLWPHCAYLWNTEARNMKLSFLPILIGVVCLVLTISLLFLHNTPKYHGGEPKYHLPKKSFQVGAHEAAGQNLRTALPIIQSNSGPVHDASEEVHAPTSPPIPVDMEHLTEIENAEPLQAALKDASRGTKFENLRPSAAETDVPAGPAIKSSLLGSLKAVEHAALEILPLKSSGPDPSTPPTLAPSFISKPAFHVTLEVGTSEPTSAFSVLRSLHSTTIEDFVHVARVSAEVIYPDSSQAVPGASASELAGNLFEFRALERLHRALRTGTVCGRLSHAVRDSNLYLAAQSLFESKDSRAGPYRAKAIVEYMPADSEASSTVAFHIAAAYPTVTALILQLPTAGSGPSGPSGPTAGTSREGSRWEARSSPCAEERPGSNLFVADGTGNPLDRAEHHQFYCVQVIPTLELLVGSLLPFEFEEVLGNILCRCNATFVPQSLPDVAYFAFWDSASHLLSSVEKVIPSTCSLSYDSDSYGAASTVRSSHIVVQRNDTLPAASSGASSTSGSATTGGTYSWSYAAKSSSTSSSVNDKAQAEDDISDAVVAATSKRYLSVGVLSALALDTRSRQNLWASVFLHRSSQGGSRNSTAAMDLLVRGAVVHTARDLVALASGKRRRKGMELVSDALPVPATADGTALSAEASVAAALQATGERRNVLVASTPELPANHAGENNATAVLVVTSTTAPPAPEYNLTATEAHRRKLYAAQRTGDSSPSYGSSVRRNSKGAGDGGEDNMPSDSSALTWEYPEDAAAEFDSVDSSIESALSALALSESVVGFETSARTYRSASKYGISSASRDLQRHLHARESDNYRRWMAALKAPVPQDGEVRSSLTQKRHTNAMEVLSSSRLVYVMGRHISLLSLKLSKLLAAGSVASSGGAGSKGILVSLLSDSLSYHSHALMSTMMALRNNVICRPSWNPATMAALLVSPERAALSLVQVDVVVELMVGSLLNHASSHAGHGDDRDCGARLVEESLAALLSMSSTTLVELPSAQQLRQLISDMGLSSECVSALHARYAGGATRLLELAVQQLKLGASAELSEVVIAAPQSGAAAETAEGVKIYRVEVRHLGATEAAKFANTPAERGLSLYTALQLGLINQQKMQLLKMLLDFPLWKFKPTQQVRPWELFLRLTSTDSGGQSGHSGPAWSVYYSSSEEVASSSSGGIDAVSRNHAVYAARLRGSNAAAGTNGEIGVSQSGNDPRSDRVQGRAVWKAIEYELESHGAELAEGRFSFVEHDSGFGYVSLRLAKSFPNATVISIERSHGKVAHHVAMASALGVQNNAVCRKADSDANIYRNIYESPELFRFQLLSRSMLDSFVATESLADWGAMLGTLLSTALTTFVYAPHAAQVSWAMYVLFAEVYEFVPAQGRLGDRSAPGFSFFRRYALPAVVRPMSDIFGGSTPSDSTVGQLASLNSASNHPQYPYRDFETQWVMENARVKGGDTAVHLSPLAARDKLSDTNKDRATQGFGIPIVRCDIVNMTRHVHHHYEYSKDGHTRTYTMRVRVNQALSDHVMSHIGDPSHTTARATPEGILLSTANQPGVFANRYDAANTSTQGILLPLGYHPDQHSVVGVHLFRDRDTFPIPYTNIYGVTLISALRLGLEESQRDRLFKDFLKMPLYEDMAPWNVVLMGPVSFPRYHLLCKHLISTFRSYLRDLRRAWTISTTIRGTSPLTRLFHRRTRYAISPAVLPRPDCFNIRVWLDCCR